MRARAAGLALVAAAALFAAGCGGRDRTVRIGVITDCEGVFASGSEAILAGAQLPLIERGAKLVGHKPSEGIRDARMGSSRIELHYGCAEITYMSQLIESVRRLVERDHVDVVLGPPLGETDGVVLRDLARRYPRVAFLVGVSGAQELTLRDPAPNVFRLVADGAQSAAGLGTYAFRDLGWRRAAVVEPDTVYAWPEAAGFLAEFCSLGGDAVRVPAPPFAAAAVAAKVPTDVDGVMVLASTFGDAAQFVAAYRGEGPPARRLLFGPESLNFVDPKTFAKFAPLMRGTVVGSAVPYRPGAPAWARFRASYRRVFKNLIPLDSPADVPIVVAYYSSMSAVVQALSRGGPLLEELAKTRLETPIGPVRLDGNRQAVLSSYLTRIDPRAKRPVRTFRVVAGVEQTFGGYLGPRSAVPSISGPACHRAPPPRWSRPRPSSR